MKNEVDIQKYLNLKIFKKLMSDNKLVTKMWVNSELSRVSFQLINSNNINNFIALK